MPVTKNAMARYRIIDRLLADPNRDYTTDDIQMYVNKECPNVSLRMIQKDIKALEEAPFNKKLVRNKGGRGTVRYADQSAPIFYQELTSDEEEMLREVLRSLGQFDGLDNFTWLELLKKKLDMKEGDDNRPVIVFSKNNGLQVPQNLLARLFSAISHKKVIRLTYTKFGDEPKQHIVYPYQLKQYNDRWYLLCTPLSGGYNPNLIINLPLDRIDPDFEYIEEEPFVDTQIDLKARYDEIIGVTLKEDVELEQIIFAVSPSSVSYVKTKYMHFTQLEFPKEEQIKFRRKYPSLSDWTFFTIECRPNRELEAAFTAYGADIVIIEPEPLRVRLSKILQAAVTNYLSLG